MVKRIAALACGLVVSGTFASAQDIPARAPATVVASSWAGLYVGAGYGRNRLQTQQGTYTNTMINPVPPGPASVVETHSLDQQHFFDSAHVLAGLLFQHNNFVFGIEGDYSLGGRAKVDRQYLLAPGCSPGVPITGMYGCASAGAFGSFETKGHVRAIVGADISPRLMAFIAGGLAIGQLGNGGIQAGAFLTESPFGAVITGAATTYGQRTLYGKSVGGGAQIKISESLIGRLEYLHDSYTGPTPTAFSISAMPSGTEGVTTTVNPQRMRLVNESVRASLIYRLDPSVSIYDAAARDLAVFSAAATGNGWAGFYVGAGVSQNNYDFRYPNGRSLTIDNYTLPGIDYSEQSDLVQSGQNFGANFLFGYRYQWRQLVVGVEGDVTSASAARFSRGVALGQFGRAGNSAECYPQVLPTHVCVSLQGVNGGVKPRGHLRWIAGLELTPTLLAFGTYGTAFARAYGNAGASGGIVISPPSAPLAGASVPPGNARANITGQTIGGGFELKATDSISIRGEYMRDFYSWNAPPCQDASFGGTIGDVTTNGMARCNTPVKITNEAYQASIIYRFWNPQL
ncbi:MAG TPA: hypothetical protein VFB68_09905 [Xanthobacteraceae bacterium]|nr:hypothetical protein [Xanthobacteraceae bacterium]